MNVQYDVATQATDDYYTDRHCPFPAGSRRADMWHSMVEEWAEEDRRARAIEEERVQLELEEQQALAAMEEMEAEERAA